MPVEDVSRYKGIQRGAIPSSKLGRMVHWKSALVRDYIYLLEYDPYVLSYEEQPCTIAYSYRGQSHTYTPDFLVQRSNHAQMLIACTSSSHLHDQKYLVQWTAASIWCQQTFSSFAFITERTLQPHRVLIENLRLLAVHAHRTIDEPVCEIILRTVAAVSHPLSLPEIIELTPDISARIIPGVVWHLLAVGRLTANLTQPLHVLTTQIGGRSKIVARETTFEVPFSDADMGHHSFE